MSMDMLDSNGDPCQYYAHRLKLIDESTMDIVADSDDPDLNSEYFSAFVLKQWYIGLQAAHGTAEMLFTNLYIEFEVLSESQNGNLLIGDSRDFGSTFEIDFYQPCPYTSFIADSTIV